MLQNTLRVAILLVLPLIVPIKSYATPVLYYGEGTMTANSDGIERNIYASMVFEDQLQSWEGGGSGDNIVITPGAPLPSEQYQFHISYFSLFIEGVGIFAGDSGSIYAEADNPEQLPPGPNLFFLEWNLNCDSSEGFWEDHYMGFYHEDGTEFMAGTYTSPDYGQLAPIIDFTGTYNYYGGQEQSLGDMNLVMHSVAPIPEPTTLLLFGTGLAALVTSKRRRRKK